MIRQKNVHERSSLGLFLWKWEYATTLLAGVHDSNGIVFADVDRIEIVEMGAWIDSISGGGPSFGLNINTEGDGSYGTELTLVKASAVIAVAAAKTVLLDHYDPPVSVDPDYAVASTNVTQAGFENTGGVIKLSMVPAGDHTACVANVWAWLRVINRRDL